MKLFNQPYRPDHEISSGQRVLKTGGSQFDYLFPKANGEDKIVMKNGEVTDTLKVLERVVWTYLDDTKKIAQVLKRSTTEATLAAIWDFLYYNIQYKLDKEGLEELRRPARSWAERLTGIDCDCFSIFCSSILTNLGIAHKFRITQYSQDYWQHIYVIVPKPDGKGSWKIDAVLNKYNYEKPFTKKMEYSMSLNGINIAVLSGFEDKPYQAHDSGIIMNQAQLHAANNVALNAVLFGVDLEGLGLLEDDNNLNGFVSNAALDKGLYLYLLATRQAIAENPATAVIAGYNYDEIVKMLDYAIHYWFSVQRGAALGQLINNENILDHLNGFHNLNGLKIARY